MDTYSDDPLTHMFGSSDRTFAIPPSLRHHSLGQMSGHPPPLTPLLAPTLDWQTSDVNSLLPPSPLRPMRQSTFEDVLAMSHNQHQSSGVSSSTSSQIQDSQQQHQQRSAYDNFPAPPQHNTQPQYQPQQPSSFKHSNSNGSDGAYLGTNPDRELFAAYQHQQQQQQQPHARQQQQHPNNNQQFHPAAYNTPQNYVDLRLVENLRRDQIEQLQKLAAGELNIMSADPQVAMLALQRSTIRMNDASPTYPPQHTSASRAASLNGMLTEHRQPTPNEANQINGIMSTAESIKAASPAFGTQQNVSHPKRRKSQDSNNSNKSNKMQRPNSLDTAHSNGATTSNGSNTTHSTPDQRNGMGTPLSSASSGETPTPNGIELIQLSEDSTTDPDLLWENLVSTTIFKLFIKRMSDMEKKILSQRKMPFVHLNMMLAFANTCMQPKEYTKFVKTLLDQPVVSKVISATGETDAIANRQYILDWSRSPADALPDTVLTPALPLVITQTHSMKPRLAKQKSLGDIRSHNSENGNSTENLAYQKLKDVASHHTKSQADVNSVSVTQPTPTTIEFNNASDVASVFRDAAAAESVPISDEHMSQLADSVRNQQEIEVVKSIVVNREFERVFGFSQPDLRELSIRFGNLALWRLMVPVEGFVKATQEYHAKRTPAAKAAYDEERTKISDEFKRLIRAHHLCVINGQSQFSIDLQFSTKHGGIVPVHVVARAIFTTHDSMLQAWSYYIIPRS